MTFISTFLLTGLTLIGPPDEGTWSFIGTSSGDNVLWTSPSPITAIGDNYEMLYTINAATVMVSYIGITFGPIDVIDMLPEDVIETWRATTGPAPLDFGWIEVVAPADQDPPAIAFDWIVEIDAKGYVSYRMENLFLGQSDYDLGWPWGSVTVNVESGTIDSTLSIQSVAPPCYADINGDTVVDVVDLLEAIGSWGYCFECPADINQDALVDVTDLLAIVAAWGQCPG